jgi:ATP-binding cassette subfamily F protein 1
MDADFKYPGRDDFGLQGLNIGIDMGSRVAIVGPNGAPCPQLCMLLSCRRAGALCQDREA